MSISAFVHRAYSKLFRPREERWFDKFVDAMGKPSPEEKAFYLDRNAKGVGVGLDEQGNMVRAFPGGTYLRVTDENGTVKAKILEMPRGGVADESLLADRLTVHGRRVGDHGIVYDVYLDRLMLDGAQMRFGGKLSDREMRLHAARRLLEHYPDLVSRG